MGCETIVWQREKKNFLVLVNLLMVPMVGCTILAPKPLFYVMILKGFGIVLDFLFDLGFAKGKDGLANVLSAKGEKKLVLVLGNPFMVLW